MTAVLYRLQTGFTVLRQPQWCSASVVIPRPDAVCRARNPSERFLVRSGGLEMTPVLYRLQTGFTVLRQPQWCSASVVIPRPDAVCRARNPSERFLVRSGGLEMTAVLYRLQTGFPVL